MVTSGHHSVLVKEVVFISLFLCLFFKVFFIGMLLKYNILFSHFHKPEAIFKAFINDSH